MPYPHPKGTFQDDFPFPKVGYVSFLEGNSYQKDSRVAGLRLVSKRLLFRLSLEPLACEKYLDLTSGINRVLIIMTVIIIGLMNNTY